jgi:solute carrier family 25 protein 39/40
MNNAIKTDDLTKQIIASSCASFITNLSLNPLNVLKVRLQNQHSALQKVSVFNIGTNLIRAEGIRGLWSGTAIALTMSVPSTILFMTAYERFKVNYRDLYYGENKQKSIDPWFIPASAAATARAFSVSMISPLELARTIKSAGNKEATVSILLNLFKKEGIRGLYKGLGATLWRDCPFSAIYWFNVELWKPIYFKLLSDFYQSTEDEETAAINHPIRKSTSVFLSGLTGSLTAAMVTHPFDVIKTQGQLSTSSTILPQNSLQKIATILKEEGAYGLYRGVSMRLLTVLPGSAILVTVYEAIKAIDF